MLPNDRSGAPSAVWLSNAAATRPPAAVNATARMLAETYRADMPGIGWSLPPSRGLARRRRGNSTCPRILLNWPEQTSCVQLDFESRAKTVRQGAHGPSPVGLRARIAGQASLLCERVTCEERSGIAFGWGKAKTPA